MDAILKPVYEKFPIAIDFATDLDDGETISTKSVACTNYETGANTKATIVGAESLVDTQVKLEIKAGAPGDKHWLVVGVRTSYDNYFEKELLIEIGDRQAAIFDKRPNDEFTVSYDFTNRLEAGDSIASRSVTATKISDGTAATTDVIEGTLITSPKVLIGVKGGVKGQLYRIMVDIVTTNTFQYQAEVLMRIR